MTLIIICVTLTILLAASAVINNNVNNQVQKSEDRAIEAETTISEMETLLDQNNQTINTILEQFTLISGYNQTELTDDFTETDSVSIVDDYMLLFTYTNGTMTLQRYYFPTLDDWSPTYITKVQ